jgi:hypothetical protein
LLSGLRDGNAGELKMKLYHDKNGNRRIHIEDTDNYDVTDDNGVDFYPTEKQVKYMVKVFQRTVLWQ